MYSTSDFVSPKSYKDWFVVDEIDYMLTESTMRSQLSSHSDDDSSYSGDTYDNYSYKSEHNHELDLDKIVAEKIDQINRETNDDIKKIKNKLNQIESRWDEGNIKKYTENKNKHPELSKIDRLLGEAIKEVVEIQKGANMAVLELSKSVENVDEIYSKTMVLKDSTDKFRKKAYREKVAQPMSLKSQLMIAASAFLGLQFLLGIFSMFS
ncbi:hypothetical protein MACK_001949 [Theileria orientalis]|uniref:Uncharacterized protein n=1 Tax=Theileria orientalis TaxID=68886 RepID=A0A976QUM2_THEOR|nr:hypothetical protein MACK_001949 [Theileria orientalis]